MIHIFRFPDIGEGITEGKIIKWYVKKGQAIKSGDSIVKMETDKVVTDIPSPKTGIIAKTFGNEGDTINVEDPLVEINIEGKEEVKQTEQVEEKGFGVVGTIEVAKDSSYMPVSNEGTTNIEEKNNTQKSRVLATPVARAMAKDLNVDIKIITGSGPAGRIMKSDIQNFHQNKSERLKLSVIETVEHEYKPMSQMRKTIAKNMLISKQSAPHMTAFEEVEISDLINVRNKYKLIFAEKEIKLTYIPFIIKAVSEALKHYPGLNSEMDMKNDRIIYKKVYNIGMAVDTDEGLIVPVIKNADKMSIRDIAIKTNELATRGKKRELKLEELKEGTFTVTNFGSIAGTFGVPIINYPQAAILGIGRIMKVPVVVDNEIQIGNILPLSLSVDHRIVDGGEAARFLLKLKSYLNDPLSLLMG